MHPVSNDSMACPHTQHMALKILNIILPHVINKMYEDERGSSSPPPIILCDINFIVGTIL